MEIVGGEIRTEIGSMAEDRAVLHKAIAEEHPLSFSDVLVGEEYITSLPYCSRRNRWFVFVRPVREKTQDKETKNHYDGDRLNPAIRDEKTTVSRFPDRFHISLPAVRSHMAFQNNLNISSIPSPIGENGAFPTRWGYGSGSASPAETSE